MKLLAQYFLFTSFLLVHESGLAFSTPTLHKSQTEAGIGCDGDCGKNTIYENPLLHTIGVFVEDDRVGKDRLPGTIYGSIGSLVTQGGDAGTAFLVSPCHILSVQHDIPNKPEQVVFKAGKGTEKAFRYSTKATPILWGDNYQKEINNGTTDFILFELEQCLGAPEYGLGYLELDPIKLENIKGKVQLAGQPYDQDPGQVWVDENCSITGRNADVGGWKHDCASREGQSGGPVFYIENGKAKVIAIHSMEMEAIDNSTGKVIPNIIFSENMEEALNTAVPIAEVYGKIKKYLPPPTQLSQKR